MTGADPAGAGPAGGDRAGGDRAGGDLAGGDLADRYRRYLDCLNDRRLADLAEYLHERLTYNGGSMTSREYRDQRAAEMATIPDLRFVVDQLVVQGDRVAARLAFDCTPSGEFLGLRATGRRISFAEHVFYRFRDGRIEEVWSLIDQASVAAQLGG